MDAMDRIRKAFAEMPYGGIAGFVRKPAKDYTLDDVAINLEKLVATLKDVAEENSKTKKELYELLTEMRAVKSFLRRLS